MLTPAQIAQDAWVLRVLGVTVVRAPDGTGQEGAPAAQDATGAEAGWTSARQGWLAANDLVNDQLGALRTAILKAAEDDPDRADLFHEIADQGLNAITANHRVRLMAALQAIGDGAPAAKALDQVTQFRTFLAGNEEVRACDGNPFGVPVAIAGTLGPALDRLAAALERTA